MGVQENFRTFINKYKVEKGKPFTNTSIGNPKISIFIPNEVYNDFIDIYSLALTNDIALHFTEKPLDPSPLRIDIDFRFSLPEINNDSNTDKNKRVYTSEHIFNIVNNYFNIINTYIKVKDEDNIAYVMEKPNPTDFRNKLKDGLHIIFPKIIVSNNVQHFIRKKILDIASELFKGLPVCNEFESIIDKAIIDVNCWQMYGSRKPDCDAYRVSKVYTYSNKITKQKEYHTSAADELNYIKLFSMRNINIITPLYDKYIKEIDEYIKHVLPSFDQKQKVKLHNNIFSKSLNINKNYTTDDELILSRQLVSECLGRKSTESHK